MNFGIKKTQGILVVFFIPELGGVLDTRICNGFYMPAFRNEENGKNPCGFLHSGTQGCARYKDCYWFLHSGISE